MDRLTLMKKATYVAKLNDDIGTDVVHYLDANKQVIGFVGYPGSNKEFVKLQDTQIDLEDYNVSKIG